MSVAGFKKQFYKASQMVSEKVGGAEGTKLDEDFKDLERKVDVTSKAVVEVISKTSEYLQPNPGETHHLPLPMILSGRLPWVPVGHTPYSEGSTHVKDLCQLQVGQAS
ncbi:endophilin-A2-like [Hypomesus transpacificus]|uniref:endophilin-A2-like n=1 Tax=Hypomesus transpacificus TaxID=137520 RepID=UPI001F085C1B|nr:endophilin-A2-like [Hypomesus transpacificus]